MTEELVCILLLGTVLLGSNAFWMFAVWRLTDKLMSRNYHEFVSGENLKRSSGRTDPTAKPANLPAAEDLSVLNMI